MRDEEMHTYCKCRIEGCNNSIRWSKQVDGMCNECTWDRVKELEDAVENLKKDRDFLVSEYERAVGSEPQGFLHAAMHIYNAIRNAKCDANSNMFIELVDERDKLKKEEKENRDKILEARQALAFFRCVILDGEDWSDECQKVFDSVLADEEDNNND